MPPTMIYTPIQFQATLKSLGYNSIIQFQIDYKLPQTGQADSETQSILAKTVRNLKHNINLVFQPPNPLNPSNMYDDATKIYVREFQQRMGVPDNGNADIALRIHLDRWAKNGWVCGYVGC